MNDDIKFGILLALQGIKEQIENITTEMKRKGIDTKYFEPLKSYIEDRISECEEWKVIRYTLAMVVLNTLQIEMNISMGKYHPQDIVILRINGNVIILMAN